MFLFWLGVFVVCCIAENLKDSYDAYKYKQSGKLDEAFKAFSRDSYRSEELDKSYEEFHKNCQELKKQIEHTIKVIEDNKRK